VRRLQVEHLTLYRYARPVAFGEHRLMLRPRDSHDLRLIAAELTIEPAASLRWQHDVFGNSIALARFDPGALAATLGVVSRITVEHFPRASVDFPLAPEAETLPFSYGAEDLVDLGRTRVPHHPDPGGAVTAFARRYFTAATRGTTAYLLALTQGIQNEFAYRAREEEGVQAPAETLMRRSGSCRDFALLMMEAVRTLGLAARFVSGYLYDGRAVGAGQSLVGGGAPHAWVEVFLPGAGWQEFDPTNGLFGGENLIRVAVARDPAQAIPISGTYFGAPEDFLGLDVEVRVTPAP